MYVRPLKSFITFKGLPDPDPPCGPVRVRKVGPEGGSGRWVRKLGRGAGLALVCISRAPLCASPESIDTAALSELCPRYRPAVVGGRRACGWREFLHRCVLCAQARLLPVVCLACVAPALVPPLVCERARVRVCGFARLLHRSLLRLGCSRRLLSGASAHSRVCLSSESLLSGDGHSGALARHKSGVCVCLCVCVCVFCVCVCAFLCVCGCVCCTPLFSVRLQRS